MNFYKPTDLKQCDSTFNFIAKSGIGFAVMPNGEEVFISARDVSVMNLEVGDSLRVWAVDNHTSETTKHFTTRWRAVKVEVLARISDVIKSVQQADVTETAGSSLNKEVLVAVEKHLKLERPWRVSDMADEIAKAGAFASVADLNQRVGNHLLALHNKGEAACLKIYAKGLQTAASAVYYAKDADVLHAHLDTPLTEEA